MSYSYSSPVADAILLAMVVVGFTAWLTLHASLVFGLALRAPRARAAVGLFVPPLAIYWGFAERMWVRAIGAVVAVLLYASGQFIR